MASAAEVLPPLEDATDIIELATKNPGEFLLNEEIANEYIKKAWGVARFDVAPDVNTAKGRKEFTALSGKFVTAKTAIDKFRLSLTADLRQQVADINAAGKILTSGLAEIAAEVRKPLTEWEQAEKAREAKCAEIISWLKNASVVTISDTSATVRGRGREVYNQVLTKEQFGKQLGEAQALKDAAVTGLQAALARLIEQEDQAAELERLRAEAAERAERDAREAAERAAAEREAEEARLADELRAAAEKAEAERMERAKQEAAESAARAVQEAAQREIDEANARAAEAERAAQAERDRIAAEKAEADRIAAQQQAEQERREKNLKHRREINGQIKADLIVAGGVTEDQATAIVKAMAKGAVRNVEVRY